MRIDVGYFDYYLTHTEKPDDFHQALYHFMTFVIWRLLIFNLNQFAK